VAASCLIAAVSASNVALADVTVTALAAVVAFAAAAAAAGLLRLLPPHRLRKLCKTES
jgi:hypothetical protein